MADISVVIVDDELVIRASLVALLSVEPFAVVAEAGDGAAAVEAVRRHSPDVVLLDINMPVMDGLTAVPFIREASPDTAIVIFSAGELPTPPPVGVDACLDKGVPVSALRAALLSAARGRGQAKDET